jgi:hypothetical protein
VRSDGLGAVRSLSRALSCDLLDRSESASSAGNPPRALGTSSRPTRRRRHTPPLDDRERATSLAGAGCFTGGGVSVVLRDALQGPALDVRTGRATWAGFAVPSPRSGAKPTEVDGTRRCWKPRHRRPRWIPARAPGPRRFSEESASEDGEPRRFTRVHERRQTCKRNGFQIGSKRVTLAWFCVVVALPIGVRPLACAARACGPRRRRLDRRRAVRGAGRPGRACGSC